MFVGALLGLAVPVLHMSGRGVGVDIAIGSSSEAFFFVWTLIAIGVTALFSLVLPARGLWTMTWGQRRRVSRERPGSGTGQRFPS
jgi:hypothetical protein